MAEGPARVVMISQEIKEKVVKPVRSIEPAHCHERGGFYFDCPRCSHSSPK